MLFVMLLLSLVSAHIAPYDPRDIRFDSHQAPSLSHLCGTDNLGRDIFSRILAGIKISLVFAVGASSLSFAIGALLGGSAGYFRGGYDYAVTQFFDVLLMLPRLLLLILVISLFGSNIWRTMLLVGVTMSPITGKLMRAQVLSLAGREYVLAGKSIGASDWRLLLKHVVPNGLPVVLANATLQASNAILLEAGLSFLGLGDPNVITIGQMLSAAQPYVQIAWWSIFFPGVAIAILVLGFHLLGEGLGAPSVSRAVPNIS
jgi:peptide/nickel transport system permease protein